MLNSEIKNIYFIGIGGAGMLPPVDIGGGIDGPTEPTVFFPRRAFKSILGFFFSSSAIDEDSRRAIINRAEQSCSKADTSDLIPLGQE